MGKITVLNHLTLDGVMQAPGRPNEDRRDGFAHGGWAMPRGAALGTEAAPPSGIGALLFGRRTYEDFHGFWPHQTDNPFTGLLNQATKYVASRSLHDPLPWENSTLLKGDAADAVAALKPQLQQDLLIMGSGQLIQSLMARDLIDTFILMIHPIVLGTGRRMFESGGPSTTFRLARVKSAPGDVMIATYELASASD